MRRVKFRFVVVVTTLVASALWAGLVPAQTPDRAFEGRVYDIDYNQDWTQVLVLDTGGGRNPTFYTKSELLQEVLEASLVNGIEVQGAYRLGNEPVELQTVMLRPKTACSAKGCVEEVLCNAAEATCSATIREYPKLKTNSLRALGILLAGISKNKAVQEIGIASGDSFARVKINVDTGPLPNGHP
jgi:hypothetical protein